MSQNLLVVVGAGALPELPMSAACHDLASALDAVLVQEACGQPPHPLLQTLTKRPLLPRSFHAAAAQW